MPTLAIVLVLVAAVLHAGWNVLLKTSGDTLTTAVRLQAIGTVVLLPVAVAAWLVNDRPAVSGTAFALAMGSAVLEATYFVCLASAYRRGGLSLVYPLARGSAPLLAVAVGIGVLGEQLAPLALIGVAFLLAGILLVARPWQALRSTDPAHRAAIGFALLTGVSIAAYSTVDRIGVREAPPWLYGSILAVGSSILTFTVVTLGRRKGWLAPAPTGPPPVGAPTGLAALGRDAAAGVLSLTAYLLVLVAYSIAPLATVAPLRESGIVLAAAWGAIRLREAKGRRDAGSRIAAALLVVLGAALLAAAR
ncbi:MAG TPA: EamA family transporter [Candidatus Limnocylindrales bacterium]|nr:EamA family transporter [Candidatus Limnocylindrales bacterium]